MSDESTTYTGTVTLPVAATADITAAWARSELVTLGINGRQAQVRITGLTLLDDDGQVEVTIEGTGVPPW